MGFLAHGGRGGQNAGPFLPGGPPGTPFLRSSLCPFHSGGHRSQRWQASTLVRGHLLARLLPPLPALPLTSRSLSDLQTKGQGLREGAGSGPPGRLGGLLVCESWSVLGGLGSTRRG